MAMPKVIIVALCGGPALKQMLGSLSGFEIMVVSDECSGPISEAALGTPGVSFRRLELGPLFVEVDCANLAGEYEPDFLLFSGGRGGKQAAYA